MDIAEHCREKAAIPGSSYYYSILFLPPEQQRALNVIYAFKAEIEDIRRSSDPGIARIKCEWWREELRRALEGTAQHPVAQGMALLIAEHDLASTDLLAIIDSIEHRLNGGQYPAYSALKEDHRPSAEALARWVCRINDCKSEKTPAVLRDLYATLEIAYGVQSLREEIVRGWIPLPVAEMQHYGLSAWDLLSNPSAPQARELMAQQITRLRQELSSALASLPACDRSRQIHSLIMGEIMSTTLEEVQRDGCRVLEHRTALTPLRKLWIAWRIQRKEGKRRMQD